jgi:hypothetical protein
MDTHRLALALLMAAGLLAGCAGTAKRPSAVLPATAEAAPQPIDCPAVAKLPAGTRCLSGRDTAGAFYLIAIPAAWNNILVLHAHGGPALGAPALARSVEDLQRWAITVKAGYAWAGSSFRQGGVAVRAAAEDTERLRRIFVQHVARPQMTILHGQSWGANVASVGASMFTDDGSGRHPYDAVLLTSGLVSGGARGYEFRLDLRVIYQSLCGNHPRPDEAQYPLWMGLPQGATLTAAQLRDRVNQCLALDKPAAQRTPEQQRKIQTIVDVVKIPADSIGSHLAWGTFHFQDIAFKRAGGRNVFGNIGARYSGSPDDAALNRSVARYAADPQARAAFVHDTEPDGRIPAPVPVLNVHAIDDPTVFVEVEDTFRQIMEKAGSADRLVQTYTADNTHSYLSDPVYPTLLAALVSWARGGAKPTPQQIAQQCEAMQASFGPGCRFRPDYRPRPLSARVAPRN